MKEIWKTIEEYPDYMISNVGRVYSNRSHKMLKSSLDPKGYPRVSLGQNMRWTTCAIHRLVVFAFVDGYFEGAEVNHKDGIKTNNKYSNLEWVTNKDNMRHASTTGLMARRIRIIETGDIFMYLSSCARYIDGKEDSILKCLNGTQKSHKGFHFEYINKGLR